MQIKRYADPHLPNLNLNQKRHEMCAPHNSNLPFPPRFVSSPHTSHFGDLTKRSIFAHTPELMI
jgi:hypothetical protein